MNEYIIISIILFILSFLLGYYLGKYKKWYILKNLGLGKPLLKYFIIAILLSMIAGIVFGNGYTTLTFLVFVSFHLGQCFGKDPDWIDL